jgi:phage baseplate assembly protein W
MMEGRFRAWRFVHPDFDQPEGAAGLLVSNLGRIDMVEEHAAVRQSLLLLLSTRPGERVMHPQYGCHLHRLMFAPNDETTAGLAIHYVRQALTRFEPRVELLRIDALRGDDTASAGRLEIVLEYRVRATQRADELTFPFDLLGERA